MGKIKAAKTRLPIKRQIIYQGIDGTKNSNNIIYGQVNSF